MLAKAVCQSKHHWLTHGIREQAHSHIGLWLSAEYVNATKPCGSWLASDGGVSGNTILPDPASSLASQLPQGVWCFQDGSVGALVIARLAADMHAAIIAGFSRSMDATIIADFTRAVDAVVITDFTRAVDAMVIPRFSMGAAAAG
ncbi:hypothetical protein FGA82_08460 [Pseudomonas fluorescens]|nr:hypothetical protein FGA82_08460 [Pseudomonas fluorescens]